jgi:hypothetical protein
MRFQMSCVWFRPSSHLKQSCAVRGLGIDCGVLRPRDYLSNNKDLLRCLLNVVLLRSQVGHGLLKSAVKII